MTLLQHLRPTDPNAPHLLSVRPTAAMPGGIVDLRGSNLGSSAAARAVVGDVAATVTFRSAEKVTVRIPEGAISGDLTLAVGERRTNALPVNVAVPVADNLHPIANPAVDTNGNIYVTFSGARGQEVPVSIFQVDREFAQKPFVRGLMNASGLAFGPDGYLYCSSRAEGTVYRISPEGAMTQWAEGMGIATGLAFDADGNLYVGDRSGTIFKLNTGGSVFVFATLEPSVSAYHLAFNGAGTLLVTGPTTSSHESIHAISPAGEVTVWYRGLGRPQGLAVDVEENVYVAASLRGDRGIIRITPDREAGVAVSGSGLVGLAFTGDGSAALATTGALFHVDMQVMGRLTTL